MRATLLCLTAIMLGSLLVIPTVAFALDYKARAWEHHGGQSRILAESQGPTPPQSVQGSWMLNDDWAHHMAYFSDMDRGQYKFHLSVVAMRRNGWFAVGGDATWNDLIFECDDGRASVDVIANLRIKGDVNFRDWGGAVRTWIWCVPRLEKGLEDEQYSCAPTFHLPVHRCDGPEH
jgi:hypothetical protein